MNYKSKKALFVCSISENMVKLVKSVPRNSANEISDLEMESLPAGINDAKLSALLSSLFKRLSYANNRVIVSLPVNQATCRYLKIPSLSQKEIQNIACLQAARFLPYPCEELITSFQVLFTDRQGYSHINLTIAHKGIIERYLNIFKTAGINKLDIFLSSYGISNIYSNLRPADKPPVIVVNIDSNHAELVINSNKKMVFNRYFKLNKKQAGWESLFAGEIDKTKDAYLKELKTEPPVKIMLLSNDEPLEQLASIITKIVSLPVETLAYARELKGTGNLPEKLLKFESSFADLIGLGLENLPASLNILPEQVKAQGESGLLLKERLNLSLFVLGIILVLSLTIAKTLDNKTSTLKQLKAELATASKEARPLEEIEKKIRLLEGRTQKTTSALDILFELHKRLPSEISLANLNYEEGKDVSLRGEAAQLNNIFTFVSSLENSSVFKNFAIKVRYATKKRTRSADRIDFEIVCSNK
jgi:Tfp pilus assembly PilM family ATPase